MLVKVLTIREAAKRLGARRERIGLMLAEQELTRATINDRTAVLDDSVFAKHMRRAQKAAA